MSIYQTLSKIGTKFVSYHILFKYGFNLSPMYRRSTGKIISVTKDLKEIRIKIPISYKNKNYVNTIFGGSMFAAVDPIPMVQLIHLLNEEYVVWDKSADIYFKKPAKENLYASFTFSEEELETIKQGVEAKNEIEIIKSTRLTNKEETITYCEVNKKIYIADKAFYKTKKKAKII